MKAVKKILIILFIILIVVGGLSYLDYFLVKTKGTLPKISIKSDYKDKEVVEYSAIFYKVWYCTADGTTILGDYEDDDPVCPNAYTFVDNTYTNGTGLKISKRDILLMTYLNIYTHEMIEIMTTEEEVNNAVYVAESYGKLSPKKVDDVTGTFDSKKYNVVVFPTFEKKDNDYEWVYDNKNEDGYYCVDTDKDSDSYLYSKYTDGNCDSLFEPIRMTDKWCSLYQNSTLIYSEELSGNLCKD